MFRIREIIEERGITPQYIADSMGVSRQYINNILAERGQVSVRTLSRIAKVLGVPVAALFEDSRELVESALRSYSANKETGSGKDE